MSRYNLRRGERDRNSVENKNIRFNTKFNKKYNLIAQVVAKVMQFDTASQNKI